MSMPAPFACSFSSRNAISSGVAGTRLAFETRASPAFAVSCAEERTAISASAVAHMPAQKNCESPLTSIPAFPLSVTLAKHLRQGRSTAGKFDLIKLRCGDDAGGGNHAGHYRATQSLSYANRVVLPWHFTLVPPRQTFNN